MLRVLALLALAGACVALPAPQPAKANADLPCTICEFVLKEVASHLPANFTEAQLEQDLDNVCKKLPATIDPECEALVKLFGDQIFKAITGGTPPDQVCTEIKLCHNSTKAVAAAKPVIVAPAPVKKDDADLPCVLCEFVLKEVASHLPANFTEAQLEQDLDNVCKKLPATIDPECEALVKLFGDKIYDAITGGTPPDQVCSEIKLCHNSTKAVPAPVEVVKAVAAPKADADIACVLCEFVLKELASHLPANFTEAELEQDLDNICKKLPATIDPECESLVKLFGDQIYKAITGGTPPDQVCTAIKVCHNSTQIPAVAKPVLPLKSDADLPCVLCEFALKELASHLPANFTEAQLEQDLDNLCEKLPATIAPECEALVKLFGDKIYDAITGGTPPDQVCTEIKLCHNSTQATAKPVVAAPAPVQKTDADIACVLCEFALKELASHLPANFTEAELEQDLDNLCKKLPATIDPECESLVKLFGDQIFKAITGGTPPDQVCTEIKLCHNSTKIPEMKLVARPAAVGRSDI